MMAPRRKGSMLQALSDAFAARLGRAPQVIAQAPGRVNLIGEHTDYNEGFTLPIATGQRTWAACAEGADGVARVWSREMAAEASWPLDSPRDAALPHWATYIAGVAALLRERGALLGGFDLAVHSDLPAGGGLSSSAALEVSCGLALAALCGEPLEAKELIDLCRRAEQEYAGVPCGIMDQTASLLGQRRAALLLDCRSRETRAIPTWDERHALLTLDTGVRHGLAASEYGKRVEECRDAVRYFQALHSGVRSLRDVTEEMIRSHAAQMAPVAVARALHVITENRRTLAAAEALRQGRVVELGRLMDESHRSLRDGYEVSCAELDRLVAAARRIPGVLGARMTGGGFGGCVIALAERSAVAGLTALADAGRSPRIATAAWVTEPSDGARVERG